MWRARAAAAPVVRGSTCVYGILGDPVAHSLSPPMQNAAFAAARLDAVYVPFHVKPPALAAAVAGLRAAGLAGWNVTVPHKEAMADLVDVLRPRARACRAVNTVIATARGLVGDNTDGDAFVAALADAGRGRRGLRVLLIGAGGSARAIASALVRAGAADLLVANRTEARARALVAALRTRRAAATGLDVVADRGALAGLDVIVNCTSTGLGPRAGVLPMPRFEATRRDVLCCDLVYGARPTPFLRRARAAGRATMDGAGMLLHQGALAFELWTGRRAPLATMRAALAAALVNPSHARSRSA